MDMKELYLERVIDNIKDKLLKIVDESEFHYIIDWDEEAELGLWNYDFGIIGDINDVTELSNKLEEVDYVATYISENYDEHDYTICCYIDVRDLK